MKKRDKDLIILLVLIPIICIVLILIGAAFNVAMLIGKILLAIVIFVLVVKICMAIIAICKSYIHKKK